MTAPLSSLMLALMNTTPTDDELAAQVGADRNAFEVLYQRYARRVFGLLATLKLDTHAADDVAQQVWLKVWQSAACKPHGSPFSLWLMQITRNAAVDLLRKRRPLAMPEEMQIAATGHHDVLEDVEESADMERFRICVAKLPDVERRVLQSRLEGLDSPSIAATIHLTTERVHRIFHDAKQKLQRCLGVGI